MGMIIHNEKLKMARLKKGLSIVKLAKAAGMSDLRISQIETGKAKSIRPENLYQICKALDIEVEEAISFV